MSHHPHGPPYGHPPHFGSPPGQGFYPGPPQGYPPHVPHPPGPQIGYQPGPPQAYGYETAPQLYESYPGIQYSASTPATHNVNAAPTRSTVAPSAPPSAPANYKQGTVYIPGNSYPTPAPPPYSKPTPAPPPYSKPTPTPPPYSKPTPVPSSTPASHSNPSPALEYFPAPAKAPAPAPAPHHHPPRGNLVADVVGGIVHAPGRIVRGIVGGILGHPEIPPHGVPPPRHRRPH